MSIKVYLAYSNPNGIVQGVPGNKFYRSSESFYILTDNGRQQLYISKKTFALALLGSSANGYKENDIGFKYSAETWTKTVGSGNSKTGWAFVGYALPVIPTPVTPTPSSSPKLSVTKTPTPSITPTMTVSSGSGVVFVTYE